MTTLKARYAVWNSNVAIALILAVCAALFWVFARAPNIANDWHGWRQADTQVIAGHFAEHGSSILLPRIDWGGAGPGYVETEFQLYPWLVSLLLSATGMAEWPGQLVSLLCTITAVFVIRQEFGRYFGPWPATLAALSLLTSRSVAYTATAVQPEALCLLLYVLAWTQLLRFEESGTIKHVALYAVFGALAMLVKPTAAQLGISSFCLLLLRSRERLRTPKIWLAWAGMLLVLGAYLLHARGIYEQYGNTFGVFSKDTSKLPRLEHFFRVASIRGVIYHSLVWGLGPIGGLAIVTLAMRRRFDAAFVALLAGNVIWTLLAIRLTSNIGGTHYHVLMSVLTAHATALAVHQLLASRVAHGAMVGTLLVALSVTLAQRSRFRTGMAPNVLSAAEVLNRHARPGDLVVVRSLELERDQEWGGEANYQDPRIHYLSGTRGWVFGLDRSNPDALAQAASAGAKFYVETQDVASLGRAFESWIAKNGTHLETSSFGARLYSLQPPSLSRREHN